MLCCKSESDKSYIFRGIPPNSSHLSAIKSNYGSVGDGRSTLLSTELDIYKKCQLQTVCRARLLVQYYTRSAKLLLTVVMDIFRDLFGVFVICVWHVMV